jgi:adenylyltransferase/sulfurtransferase
VIKIGSTTNTHISRLVETTLSPRISVDELKEDISAGNIALVDVRTAQEREDFNIGGRHIPVQSLYTLFNEMDMDTKTVFYCASGKRSEEAVKIIKTKLPDANVFSLQGGLKAWMETGG